jgi:hypothetical protein
MKIYILCFPVYAFSVDLILVFWFYFLGLKLLYYTDG